MSGNSYRANRKKRSTATKEGEQVHTVVPTGQPTNIYLLCAGHIHYTGKTDREIETRLGEHWRGNGSALTSMLHDKGIHPVLARSWPNRDRCVEYFLKCWGGARPFCPECSGEAAWNRAKYEEYIIEPADPGEEIPF